MNSYILLKLSLALHIAGITMTAGSMLMTYVVYRKFWKAYSIDASKAKYILSSTSRFPAVAGIGLLILVLSGMGMMMATQGEYMKLFWFQAKVALIVLLILNGMLIMRRLMLRLGKRLKEQAEIDAGKMRRLKNQLNVSFLVQLVFFFMIFVLAALRP